jgi:uncharacterized protein YukE
MGWTTQFLSGVGDMTGIKKLDPPVKDAMKNVQAFGQSVEAAEKMGPDLKKKADAASAAWKEYATAVDEYNKLHKEFTDLNDAIDKNLKVYKTALAAYIKKGREFHEKEYATGCTSMEKGLETIEDNLDKMAKQWGPMKKG